MKATGYFARPGSIGGRVHIVERGRPICGQPTFGSFQWCAHGVKLEYVDCRKCRAAMARTGGKR